MDIEKPPPLKETATRFVRAVRLFGSSEAGPEAKWMLAGLLALLFGANGLNVVNSYVGRNFMSAIAERQTAEFVSQALYYVAVFVASTVVAVIARFLEERLGLLWRDSLTRRTVSLYLAWPMEPITAWPPRADWRIPTSGSPTTPGPSPPPRSPSFSWRSTAR